jgi:hypothetical protein
MQTAAQSLSTPAPAGAESTTIETTLYDLIAAVSAEAGPDEDELILATVVHLLNSGQARFTGAWKNAKVVCR